MFGEHNLKRTYKSWVNLEGNTGRISQYNYKIKTIFSEKIANEPSHDILVLIDEPTYPVHIYIQRLEVDE